MSINETSFVNYDWKIHWILCLSTATNVSTFYPAFWNILEKNPNWKIFCLRCHQSIVCLSTNLINYLQVCSDLPHQLQIFFQFHFSPFVIPKVSRFTHVNNLHIYCLARFSILFLFQAQIGKYSVLLIFSYFTDNWHHLDVVIEHIAIIIGNLLAIRFLHSFYLHFSARLKADFLQH